MMSRLTDVWNDSFACYQNLLEYVGLENIWQGFHGEPALKKHYKTLILTSTSSSATTRHFIRKWILYKKDSNAYLSYDTLWTCVAIIGDEVWQFPWSAIFNRFLALKNTWPLVTTRKFQNPPKITLHGNCHSSAPITATKVPGSHFKDNGHSFFFYKEDFMKNLPLYCSARWSWSSNKGLEMFFECWFTMKPLSDIFKTKIFWKVLVADERIILNLCWTWHHRSI